MSHTRDVAVYLVLRRGRAPSDARFVRSSRTRPRLKAGECAVRVAVAVQDVAFEPVLKGPSIAFAVENTIRAETRAVGE